MRTNLPTLSQTQASNYEVLPAESPLASFSSQMEVPAGFWEDEPSQSQRMSQAVAPMERQLCPEAILGAVRAAPIDLPFQDLLPTEPLPWSQLGSEVMTQQVINLILPLK